MGEAFFYTDKMSVGYGRKIVVGGVDISVERGRILTLIGPNGSGKSTVLNSIVRQLEIISGSAFLDGRSIASMSGRELSKKMSILMTKRIDPELMTCRDVVSTGRYPYTNQLGFLTDEDNRQIEEAMEMTAVTELSEQEFACISDGQRQRVMLARAVCQQPEIMILDEPTSFLDVHHKLELLNILKKLVRERNVAVIMSMHELELAQRISDFTVCIGRNGVERCGTPDEIFNSDYISRLYDLPENTYSDIYGTVELAAVGGSPEVFVIAGGGSGAAVFRNLWRENVPFAVGVIHRNDIDYPAAKALAAQIIDEEAFEPISDSAFNEAKKLIDSCKRVIVCCDKFGSLNSRNRELAEYSVQANKLKY